MFYILFTEVTMELELMNWSLYLAGYNWAIDKTASYSLSIATTHLTFSMLSCCYHVYHSFAAMQIHHSVITLHILKIITELTIFDNELHNDYMRTEYAIIKM